MPDIAEVMRSQLNAITEIAGEVYPATSKEHKKSPYAMYRQNLGEARDSLGGWLEDRSDEFEIYVLAGTYNAMRSIGRKAETALKALQGTTTNGLHIQSVFVDENAPEIWEEQAKLYRKIINAKFVYTGGGI